MSDILLNIPDNERDGGRTKDAAKYKKDCDDFVCLDDGTILGECKYCNLSLVCRQVDVLPNGKVMPMESHYLPVKDAITGETLEWQYFCTGMHDLRVFKERKEDDKAS